MADAPQDLDLRARDPPSPKKSRMLLLRRQISQTKVAYPTATSHRYDGSKARTKRQRGKTKAQQPETVRSTSMTGAELVHHFLSRATNVVNALTDSIDCIDNFDRRTASHEISVTTPRSISGPIEAVQDRNAVMVTLFWRPFLEVSGSGIYRQPIAERPWRCRAGSQYGGSNLRGRTGPRRHHRCGKIAIGEDWITLPKSPESPQS
jgi:hypothetical protein